MAIPTRITDFSTTPGSNFPAGSETVGTAWDDYMRAYQAVVRNDLASKGADISSAATTDLGAVAGLSHDITGVVTITSFGTVSAGVWKIIKFEGALTLTHNATSLILAHGQNHLTTDGDVFEFISEGSGNWREVSRAVAGGNVPPGTVMPDAGSSAPAGWLHCFGQTVSRATYSAIFARLSTTYGAGDGSTTFALPDLRGRVVAGQDDMGGSSADRLTNQSGGLNGDTLGAVGGVETHALTSAQNAAHTHTFAVYAPVAGTILAQGVDSGAQNGTETTSSSGSGDAHNNVQPTIILNYIIKT